MNSLKMKTTSFFSFLTAFQLLVINAEDSSHAVINPVIKCTDSSCNTVKVSFSAEREQFKYELERNDKLFSDNYVNNLKSADYVSDTRCYYQSHRAGDLAALRVCNNEVSGVVKRKGKTYVITSGDGQHKLYKASDIIKPQGGSMCSAENDATYQPLRVTKTKMTLLQDTNREIYIEYVVVLDNDVVKTFGNQATALEFINQVLNLVDELLKELNGMINLVVKDVIFENSADKLKPGRVIEDQLGNFRDYAIENLYNNGDGYDVAQLLVGRQLPRPGGSNIIRGRAYRGTICSEMALGVVQLVGRSKLTHVGFMGHAIAHEIAHTLGLNHLNYSDPRCPCPDSRCIMSDDDELVDNVWSACTKDDMADLLSIKSAVDYSCLRNQSAVTSVTSITSPSSAKVSTESAESTAESRAEPDMSRVAEPKSSGFLISIIVVPIVLLIALLAVRYFWLAKDLS
ncbi:Zinc metalloproteinase-disintegrin 8 [Halotydeus destructor]|nr:Zinc metalloproteinase-disintegrin 8 [Halotydeus destructor]